MKKILSHGLRASEVFRTKCNCCDCEFEYQYSDTYFHTAVHAYYVTCPECKMSIPHSEGFKSKAKITTESL